jgi:hypothetical protein
MHDDKYPQLCLEVKLGALPHATVPLTCCERRISQRTVQYLRARLHCLGALRAA